MTGTNGNGNGNGVDRVMEVLVASRERIAGTQRGRYRWRFSSWGSCTCGHIYKTALNTGRADETAVCYPENDSVYDQALRAVLAAAPHSAKRHVKDMESSAHRVSSMTSFVAGRARHNHDSRSAALELLDRAIAARQEQHREAMRQVVAQAQTAIIDKEAVPA